MNKHLFQSTRLLFGFTLLLLILLTLSFSFSSLLGAKKPDYFPLAVGNMWKYDSRVAGFSEIRRITGTKSIDGNTYYVLKTWVPLRDREELANEELFRKDEKNQVLLRIKDKEIVWLKLSADEGTKWQIRLPPLDEEFEVALVKKDAEVDTFAGKFAHCMIFRFHDGMDADFALTLAPNVGVVEDIHFAWNELALAEYTLFPGSQVDVKPLGKRITTFGRLKQ